MVDVLPPLHTSRRSALRFVPVAAGALAVAALLGTDDGVVLCPYRRCTGGDCPLCGTTRAGGRLLRGDVAGSWLANPMALLLALQIPIYVALTRFAPTENGRSWWGRNAVNVLLFNIAMATVVWVVRLWLGAAAAPTGLMLPW